MGKTVLERQLQAYGGYQHTLRNLSADDRDRLSDPGTPGRLRYEAKVEAARKRKAEREKLLKDFMKDEPRFGHLAGLTAEEVSQITRIVSEWNAKVKRFKADLDKRLPVIEIYQG